MVHFTRLHNQAGAAMPDWFGCENLHVVSQTPQNCHFSNFVVTYSGAIELLDKTPLRHVH